MLYSLAVSKPILNKFINYNLHLNGIVYIKYNKIIGIRTNLKIESLRKPNMFEH